MNLNTYINKRGIERESLRIFHNGFIASSNHPKTLGSKLTNSNITVDFSESLLEIITEPFNSIDNTLTRLKNISIFSIQQLPSNQLLLSTSMPLNIIEHEINIAYFGISNLGKMKEIYRRGLAKRYGKIMQVISGIHYNFSYNAQLMNKISKQRNLNNDQLYFSVINQYFEFCWLFPYLFGSSPICSKNFFKNNIPYYLKELDKNFYIGEYTTSLRLSEVGYQNVFKQLISYNNLQDYIKDLINATKQQMSLYEKIGMYDINNIRQQLNTNILQIENEYYNTIRPKAKIKKYEQIRPAHALLNRGIHYLEIRALDLDPFNSIGINRSTAHFIEALLVTCLLEKNKQYNKNDYIRNKFNFNQVAVKGRYPKLMLKDSSNRNILIKDMGKKQLNIIARTAKKMGIDYENSVKEQFKKFEDVNKTPSAKLINFINNDYFNAILNLSRKNTEYLKNMELQPNLINEFNAEVNNSIQQQLKIEENDDEDLDTYINNFYHNTI